MPDLGGVDIPVGGVRDVDFEVGDREGKALRPDVRPMREARDFLFCVRPEAKPPQHANELVAKMPMAASPRPRVATARVCVVPLRVVPPPPMPGAGSPTSTTAAFAGDQGDAQPEAHQSSIFPV